MSARTPSQSKIRPRSIRASRSPGAAKSFHKPFRHLHQIVVNRFLELHGVVFFWLCLEIVLEAIGKGNFQHRRDVHLGAAGRNELLESFVGKPRAAVEHNRCRALGDDRFHSREIDFRFGLVQAMGCADRGRETVDPCGLDEFDAPVDWD